MDTVMTVGDEDISVREFRLYLDEQIAHVAAYFYKQYGISDHKQFWTTAYSGEVPEEVAKARALEQLIAAKAEQLTMVRYGVLDDIGYDAFAERLRLENKRRNDARKKGLVVYGPKQLSEKEYYGYELGNLRLRLLDAYAKEHGEPGQTVLKLRYEDLVARDDVELRLPDGLRVQVLRFETFGQSQETIEEWAAALAEGSDPVETAARYDIPVQASELDYDPDTLLRDRGESVDPVYESVRELGPGQYAKPIVGTEDIRIARLLDRQPGGFIPFEEAEQVLARRWLKEALDREIAELEQALEVGLIREVYDRLDVRGGWE